jgi:two-component system, NtrC family, sensor histidine kinase PilS
VPPSQKQLTRQDAPAPPAVPENVRSRVTTYIFLRLALVSLLFTWATYAVFERPESLLSLNSLFFLAGATFLFMGVSAALVRRYGDRRTFVLTQLLFDTLLVTVFVQLTGGLHSVAVILYFMNIVAAAWLVPQRLAGLAVAGINALAFVASVVIFSLYFSDEPLDLNTSLAIYADILLRVFGIVIIGFLTNQLAVRSQQADAALALQQETTRVLEEEHGLIVQSVLSGILTADVQGVIRSANPAALARLGTCEGRPLTAVMPGLKRYSDGQEITIRGPEEPLTLLCYRSPLGMSGGEVVVFEDVTELRRYEGERKREERLAGVGRLAAGIAHEIRNPLASLSGAIQLLKDEEEGPLLDIAQREVLRLNDLVGEFLNSARPIELRLQPVSVSAIVDEVVAAFGKDPRYGEQVDIVVAEEDDEEGGGTDELDADRVHQVLWNLLLNAAQAMPEGGTIHVGLHHTERRVTVEVRDEGTGISEEELGKVFDPFYTTRQGGTGLGLANVDRLVRAHGGTVGVRSRVGGGTTFILDFPRQHRRDDQAPDRDKD